ncbi:hypothetical protein LSH36_753g00014 [Paralvinella palmiformis]|uniref:Uncharacterized protein n=1 Tax=Paralvinella palmiformis TaxID=53620 RepID=A0AAD9J0S9_9ANNE|nr:hypothetical protein LSH36_753g00014 [Paralvinella palmiformis]
MAEAGKCIALFLMASLGLFVAMAVGDADADGPLAEAEQNNPSSFMQRLEDSYQEYFNNDQYELKNDETGASPTGKVPRKVIASKRGISWDELYSNPSRQTMGFWKRFMPSKANAFWKRQDGFKTDGQLSGFWKRNSFGNGDKNEGFWKRSGPIAYSEDDQVSPKRSFIPLQVLFHPKYRNILAMNKVAPPLRNNVSMDWLIRTLSKQGRVPSSEEPDLPLPPKDRRQEPKLNPDFNPTGW